MCLRMRVGCAVLVASVACLVGCASEQNSRPGAAAASTQASAATSTTQAGLGPCEVSPTPGLTTTVVAVDGRSYPTEIYQPERRDAAPAAAVIDLHGADSSGPAQAALTRFRQLADREGFVVAEPSGEIGLLGVTGWEIAALDEPDRDDVGAMNRLIEVLVDDHCVDPDRIFVAGYSLGGFLAAELACRPGSRVAAIVSVGGFHAPEQCERHVPTLVVHGTADPIVPLGPNGMSFIVDDTTPPAAVELLASSIEEEVAVSARGAGCDDVPKATDLADDVKELSYEGCVGGADHTLVLVDGGGHTWPGAAPSPDEGFVGPTTANFDATEAGWAFFASYSEPS